MFNNCFSVLHHLCAQPWPTAIVTLPAGSALPANAAWVRGS